MIYSNTKMATFLCRPNRFIARVIVEGREETVHVKTTGRCGELLKEGAVVILEEAANPDRKTRYSLIAVYKGDVLINIDSQVPNTVVYEGLLEGRIGEISDITSLSREVVFGNSRFDLCFESGGRRGFLEVKGVTLEENKAALFPDAPTERGRKHLLEMIRAVEERYLGCILFLIQMKGVEYFSPNIIRDPKFSRALSLAFEKGVMILAYDSVVTKNGITIGSPVEVRLEQP